MKFGLDEIFAVIDKVTDSGLASFSYEDADAKISIQNGEKAVWSTIPAGPDAAGISGDGKAVPMPQTGPGQGQGQAPSVQAGTSSVKTAVDADVSAENCVEITSMMVGTFYAAPSEDAEPFVQAGDEVKKGQTVGIVEAMKLMNEIESEYDGVIEAVLVKNGQLVEYGQPLMRLRKK
ncbi:MAG: acetyl-CoA carboxylase biotin carboxyl carrier protein [Clostridiales bacterium]|nr:acetyl-CoA carboxylase biotin carboxyl carrier protein [Clostridiales bacterium]